MSKLEQLYAGFAKTDITPPHPHGMTLFGMDRVYPGAIGVRDPLYARATYIGTRSRGVLMVVLDTVTPLVIAPHQDEVIAELASITGLPKGRIWILCTHTHSSVGEDTSYIFDWTHGDHYRLRTLSRYIDTLLLQIVVVGKEAFLKRQAVEIGYSSAPVSEVGASRRFKCSAGIVLSSWANGPTPLPGMRLVDRGPHDPEVGLVVFRAVSDHRTIGVLLNYSSHIHLYPTLKFSAELAGAVIQKIEQSHPGLMAIYTNGAEGNVSLDAHLPPQSSRPEDWDDQLNHGLELFSTRMMKGVEAAWKKLTFASRVRMGCAEATVSLRLFAQKDGRATDESEPINKPLTALTINDLALIGHAEEAFVEMALDLKADSPFPQTFVLGFQGFRQKYFSSAHGLEEGGYESSMRYQGDALGKTVKTAVQMLTQLRQEAQS